MDERWTPQQEQQRQEQQAFEQRNDGVYITSQNANQQLVELLRKVLPENKFITPEMLVPILTITATLILSKFDFDKEQILQTVQDTNGQVVTTYNKWVPLAMALLYAVLGGGSLGYSAVVSRNKERSRQEASSAVRSLMILETEKERSRGLEITNRNLKIQNEVYARQAEFEKMNANNIQSNSDTSYSDVSQDLKVAGKPAV